MHAEDRAVFLVQLSVSEPGVALWQLEKATNEWKTGRARRQTSAEGIVAVRDNGECEQNTAEESQCDLDYGLHGRAAQDDIHSW